MNSDHSYAFKAPLNNIIPFTTKSHNWSRSSGLNNKNSVCVFQLTFEFYGLQPPTFSWFDREIVREAWLIFMTTVKVLTFESSRVIQDGVHVLNPGSAEPDHWVIRQVPLLIVHIPGAHLLPRRPSCPERVCRPPDKQDIVKFLQGCCIRHLCESCQTHRHFTDCNAAISWETYTCSLKVFLETQARTKATTKSECNLQPHVSDRSLSRRLLLRGRYVIKFGRQLSIFRYLCAWIHDLTPTKTVFFWREAQTIT